MLTTLSNSVWYLQFSETQCVVQIKLKVNCDGNEVFKIDHFSQPLF